MAVDGRQNSVEIAAMGREEDLKQRIIGCHFDLQ